MKHYKKTYPGFTLIELLTVVAVIGILAAILVPVVGSVREKARMAEGISNLRSIGSAVALYRSENNNFLPYATIKKDDWNEAHPDPEDQVTGDQQWHKQLRDYLPQQGSSLTSKGHVVFICPNAEYYTSGGELFDDDDMSLTYAATDAMWGVQNGKRAPSDVQRSLSTIASPADTYLLVDAKQNGTTYASCRSSVVWSQFQSNVSVQSEDDTADLDFRQPGSLMNVLYVDGHTDSRSFDQVKQITEQQWSGREN
ncbi:type II secretion system protein [Cerasicoccus frondis]|uniref:type II secretion system protein n=1 Tax=Cerasicoccus frondis TaxID=490090 RepID=UPI002852B184|nr:type II secretion system protein [Cerasicoccus frondis]